MEKEKQENVFTPPSEDSPSMGIGYSTLTEKVGIGPQMEVDGQIFWTAPPEDITEQFVHTMNMFLQDNQFREITYDIDGVEETNIFFNVLKDEESILDAISSLQSILNKLKN